MRGVYVVEPGEGELASGLIGKGRMAEPEEVADYLARYFAAAEKHSCVEGTHCGVSEKKSR